MSGGKEIRGQNDETGAEKTVFPQTRRGA